MLSPAVSELLGRVQSQLGLEIEVLDSRLELVYPAAEGALGGVARQSADLRGVLMRTLSTGRANQIEVSGGPYDVQPLRPGRDRAQPVGLLAVKRNGTETADANREFWTELARKVVEADLASQHASTTLRQRTRRLAAVLQFLDHLIAAADVPNLLRSLMHAVAVWLDGDARVYRREPGGDYVLQASLPGADVPERARRLRRADLDPAQLDVHALRGADVAETATGTVYVVPLATAGEPEWILLVMGAGETLDESVMTAVGRVAGVRLETLEAQACRSVRDRLLAAIRPDGRSLDLLALDALATVLAEVGATSGSLWLDESGHPRCLASVGPRPSDAPAVPADDSFASDQCTLRLPLAGTITAWLHVAAEGAELRANAAPLLREAAALLQPWLAGAAIAPAAAEVRQDPVPAFMSRLEEELARSRRFGLRLSLVVVEIGAGGADDAHVAARVQAELRAELRGSDVLGRLERGRFAILLIETDADGIGAVVHRLKQRLLRTAEALNLTTVTLGHAALSPGCRTADALLGHARRHAEPVISRKGVGRAWM